MVTQREEQAIIASCVLGVLFFLTLLIIIMCFSCRRRKHPKKREHKKHHHLSPHVSPDHSQPSTLKTTVNSTLPKAGSTGLWIDTPGMYGMPPHHNYYYGRPHGYNMHGVDHGYHIPRAMSETRIPQPGMPYVPYRHQFGSQSNVFLLPVPGQRFYHSQPLTPVFELPPTRGMEIYDYPYTGANGGFRSKLLETRHSPDYYNNTSEFILKPRVERSKSDAENRRPAKPPVQKERFKENTTSSAENGRRPASKENKNFQALLEVDEKQLFKYSGPQRATTHENVHPSHVTNPISVNSAPTVVIPMPSKVHSSKAATMERNPLGKETAAVENATVSSSDNMSSLATDSMKLLAKNKTDDQKTKPTFMPVVDNNSNRMDEANREFNIKHYKYEGSIYAMPEKNIKNTDYDNPIISRMKEMVIERSRSSNILPHRNDWDDAQESIASHNGIQNVAQESDLFKDVNKVTKVTKTKVIESVTTGNVPERIRSEQQDNSFNDIVDGLVLPDILVPDEESYKSPSSHTSVQQKSAGRSIAVAETTNDLKKSSRPVAERITDVLSPKGSADIDGGSDDLNRAGKQLATSAFQFLDNYLSDDEGTDSQMESPPLSPGGLRAGQVY